MGLESFAITFNLVSSLLCRPRLRRRKMLNLRIEVNVSQSSYGSGGLHLREEIEIPEADFLEMAKILGQFHDLAEKIKRERKP